MIRNYSLNWDYISRRVWFFRIPQYTYSLKLIFRVTLDATRAYAKQYYFVAHSMPVPNSKSSDLLPLQGLTSDLGPSEIEEILRAGFKNNDNSGYFEFYLFDESTKDFTFEWSLGDFISLNLTDDQISEVRGYLRRCHLPDDLYVLNK